MLLATQRGDGLLIEVQSHNDRRASPTTEIVLVPAEKKNPRSDGRSAQVCHPFSSRQLTNVRFRQGL